MLARPESGSTVVTERVAIIPSGKGDWNSMHIAICINRIPDPEVPAKQFRLDEQTNRPALQRVNWVIGPFDENALEMALQLRDSVGAELTVLTVGPTENQEVLRRALALRCDRAIHVKEEGATELDSWGVARLLAAALRRLGDVDLVLCGRQVGDWDGGQVGQFLAEELGFSCVTLGRTIELAGQDAVRVAKEVSGGVALVDARLPSVVTITNTSTNQIRIPKVKDAMAAYKAPIISWTASELGLDVSELLRGPRVVVRRMFMPETSVKVEMITGDSDDEVAALLAKRIVGMKVL